MKEFVLAGSEKSVAFSDISALENSVGFTLPRAFVELYLKFNGGEPNRSWIVTDDGYDPMQVVDFKSIHTEGAGNSSDTRFIDRCYKVMSERQVIPHTLLPFAVDGGGNFFLLGSAQWSCCVLRCR